MWEDGIFEPGLKNSGAWGQSVGCGEVEQECNFVRAWQALDRSLRSRGAGAIGIRPRSDQAQGRIGSRVASAFAFGVRGVSGLKIVADAGIIVAVATLDQIQAPRFLIG